mmetsp:Transcript_3544/g.13691  ORF Transcript_3544/g.13691 Transcript_3544/m.13691 type:complete len:299 (-) Transcript_3544:385-1281(-)
MKHQIHQDFQNLALKRGVRRGRSRTAEDVDALLKARHDAAADEFLLQTGIFRQRNRFENQTEIASVDLRHTVGVDWIAQVEKLHAVRHGVLRTQPPSRGLQLLHGEIDLGPLLRPGGHRAPLLRVRTRGNLDATDVGATARSRRARRAVFVSFRRLALSLDFANLLGRSPRLVFGLDGHLFRCVLVRHLFSSLGFFLRDERLVEFAHYRLRIVLVPLVVVAVDVVRLGRLGGFRAADPPATRARHAVASRRFLTEALKLVIDRQLLPLLDVSRGEYPDAQLPANHPLLRLAIRRARVI